MDRLKDKIAVVTGASSGIGRSTVELFVSEGAQVIAADIDETEGRALEERLPGRVKLLRCDVTQEDDLRNTMQAAEDLFGGLDILVNNAGASGTHNTIEDVTADGWDRTMNLLLRSVVLGMRHAIPFMKARGRGSIINIASIAALQAGSGELDYSVAKAGVVHLTSITAAQLGRAKIRVNAISPGFIHTNIFASKLRSKGMPDVMAKAATAKLFENAADVQPIPKGGQPSDIAKACLYLASDDAEFVTGANLVIDGGLTRGPRRAWDAAEAERLKAALLGKKG